MLICWGNQSRVGAQGTHRMRRTMPRRVQAWLSLLVLMLQFVLVVAHTWEVPFETLASPVALTFYAPPTSAGHTTALSAVAIAPRRVSHDPLLCPVCQLLSQARNGILQCGPKVSLPQANFVFVLLWLPPLFGPDLSASVPRAPPSFFL
jgi:hypothetical protein